MTKKNLRRTLLCALGASITALYLFPLYWMYLTAFKSSAEMFQYPPSYWPTAAEAVFVQIFNEHGMAHFLWNSLVVATGTTLFAVLAGTGAAYALAQVRNRWTDAAIFLILVLQALPPSLMVTPIFAAFKVLGLLASPRLAVILAQIAKVLPFYIVLCRSSFVQIPRELREAALVDGAGPARAFFQVILPLARNGILVTAILIFLQSFGEYVYSRSLILDDNFQTTAVGLSAFVGDTKTDWVGIMNYAAIYVTPILIVFMLLQRRIVSGLTAGALK